MTESEPFSLEIKKRLPPSLSRARLALLVVRPLKGFAFLCRLEDVSLVGFWPSWRRTRFFNPGGWLIMRLSLIVLIFVTSLQAVAQNAPATSVFDTQTVLTPRSQPAVSFAPV